MAKLESQEITQTGPLIEPTWLDDQVNNNNNNNNNPNSPRQKSTNKTVDKQGNNLVSFTRVEKESGKLEQANEINGGSRRCSASETDDWHLLEVDDQYSSDESIIGGRIIKRSKMSATEVSDSKLVNGNNNNNNNNENNNNNNNNNITVNKKNITERKYVDIDPLVSCKEANSRALIYICTVLYSLIPLASTLALITLIILAFTSYWPIPIVYLSYVIYDRNTCNRGGRRVDFVYKSKFWSYLAAYFPIKLRCSTSFKLNPNENYLLNFHPHGISAFGCVAAFGTNGLNFQELFPGIVSRFMVHESCYIIPVMREIFSARGDCSVNSKSIDYILSKGWRQGKSGNLLALVGGGLAEASLSDPKVLKIVLKSRKGFVKKAIMHGANLIPCVAFGENSVFNRIDFEPGSFMHQLESKFYQTFRFKHPLYYGASIFGTKSKGAMPYKRPITVVMGDPIKVNRIEKPSQEDVDNLHAHYLRELRSLYEANSDLCTVYDQVLELI